MVSKIPTYSLKRIIIPRKLTIFLLLGISVYVSLLIIYTFKTLFFTGVLYFLCIPISYLHYQSYIKKDKQTKLNLENDDLNEDVL